MSLKIKVKLYLFSMLTIILSNTNAIAEFEKPYDPALDGTNYRLSKDAWNLLNFTGSWVLQNIRYNDDNTFNWANWKCENPGTECKKDDWATRWSGIRITSPGPGWIQNANNEWEPPLPQAPGCWQSLYPAIFPTNYDPINDVYY